MTWKFNDFALKDGVYLWTLQDYVRTEFDFDELSIDLISENGDGLDQFDLLFIEKTLQNVDYYFDKAIERIKSELSENPDQFRLTDEELQHLRENAQENSYVRLPDNNVEKYAHVPAHEFPVNQPNLAFYPNGSWLIRFAEADFPKVNYGHGIAFFFDKDGEITDFNILEEDEQTK